MFCAEENMNFCVSASFELNLLKLSFIESGWSLLSKSKTKAWTNLPLPSAHEFAYLFFIFLSIKTNWRERLSDYCVRTVIMQSVFQKGSYVIFVALLFIAVCGSLAMFVFFKSVNVTDVHWTNYLMDISKILECLNSFPPD